jgi:hypothetical protein
MRRGHEVELSKRIRGGREEKKRQGESTSPVG